MQQDALYKDIVSIMCPFFISKVIRLLWMKFGMEGEHYKLYSACNFGLYWTIGIHIPYRSIIVLNIF
jgi:hypothetical protein